jgi:hopanoid biosynthesis associated protein HpnK
MKKLLVNADDFGLSVGVNRAVVDAWQHGVLTGASLMVRGNAVDEAVAIARENPGLQVGLHLTLVQGRSVLPGSGFPPLVDGEGYFSPDPVYAGMRYFFIRSLRKQLSAEIEAQIVRFLDTGLPLSHIDGHLNIHMHPTVFDILCRVMPKYGITTFRLTRERLVEELKISSDRRFGKMIDAFIFGKLAARCRQRLDQLGITYVDEVKGLLNSGRMTEEYFLKTVDMLQDGSTEIYFHPGCHPDAELLRQMPDYQHEAEHFALTSRSIINKLESHGIVLCNYRGEVRQC